MSDCKHPAITRLCVLVSFLFLSPAHGQSPTIKEGENRSFQIGGFFQGGFAPYYEQHLGTFDYREVLHFYSLGFESGKMLKRPVGPTLLRGRPEAIVEIMPFWIATHPKQSVLLRVVGYSEIRTTEFPSFSYPGVSVTPLLGRWNFTGIGSQRFVPWLQLGSGLLWTTKHFPQELGGPAGHTSRINFTPQVGLGESMFIRPHHSFNVGLEVVHISSAGLGEYNPGVNLTLSLRAGYSWWK